MTTHGTSLHRSAAVVAPGLPTHATHACAWRVRRRKGRRRVAARAHAWRRGRTEDGEERGAKRVTAALHYSVEHELALVLDVLGELREEHLARGLGEAVAHDLARGFSEQKNDRHGVQCEDSCTHAAGERHGHQRHRDTRRANRAACARDAVSLRRAQSALPSQRRAVCAAVCARTAAPSMLARQRRRLHEACRQLQRMAAAAAQRSMQRCRQSGGGMR
jgi:hypothetical protein